MMNRDEFPAVSVSQVGESAGTRASISWTQRLKYSAIRIQPFSRLMINQSFGISVDSMLRLKVGRVVSSSHWRTWLISQPGNHHRSEFFSACNVLLHFPGANNITQVLRPRCVVDLSVCDCKCKQIAQGRNLPHKRLTAISTPMYEMLHEYLCMDK